MRRILAGAAVAVLVLLCTAGPAQAAAPIAEFASPANNPRYGTSNMTLDVTVRMATNGTLRGNATVSWFSPENRPVPATSTHDTRNEPHLRILLENRTFPWNGTYRVDVGAVGRDGVLDQTDETGGGSSQFVIDAPPAAPAGLTTAVNSQREVAVSWSGNGEPDLVGYEVQRQLGSDPWQQVTVTGKATTSVLDRATSQAGGTYRYRVVAFRTSAEVGKLNPSTPSSTSTAKVSAPPVTTTTSTSTTSTTVAASGEEDDEEPRGGSSSGSGSTGSRTGSSSSAGGGSTATTLPSSGKVDLSGFSSLLEQARQSGQTASAPRKGEEDGGFDEKLPFSGRTRSGGDAGDDAGDEVAILEEGVSDDGSGGVQSLAFLAGGLLATVLVMHLLWVRSEIHRADVLEAVAPEPEAPPGRPRRRRPVPTAEA